MDSSGHKRSQRREFLRVASLSMAGSWLSCGGRENLTETPWVDAESPPGSAPVAIDTSTPVITQPAVDAPEQIGLSPHFKLGVSSGDVTDSSALVWTRYQGKNPVDLVLWKMQGAAYSVLAERR